jgi:hypothetical protein
MRRVSYACTKARPVGRDFPIFSANVIGCRETAD